MWANNNTYVNDNSQSATADIDTDSKLGRYLRVNSELKPSYPIPQNMMEGERIIIITRFRTGSYSLASSQPNRLCK